MVDDKELGIQELICKELNLPNISSSATEQADLPESSLNQTTGTVVNNNASADGGQRNPLMQKKVVEFVRKRVHLLEKALNYEYAEVYYVCIVLC